MPHVFASDCVSTSRAARPPRIAKMNSITVAVKADPRVGAEPRAFIVVAVSPDIISKAELAYDDNLEIGYDAGKREILVRKAAKPTRHHLKRPTKKSKKFAVRFTAYPEMGIPVTGKNQSRRDAFDVKTGRGEFTFTFPEFE